MILHIHVHINVLLPDFFIVIIFFGADFLLSLFKWTIGLLLEFTVRIESNMLHYLTREH